MFLHFFFTHFGFKDGFQETTTRPSRMNKYRNWWQLLSSERIVKYNWTNILIMKLSFPSHFSFVFAFLTMWMSMAMIQIILNQSFHCWNLQKLIAFFLFAAISPDGNNSYLRISCGLANSLARTDWKPRVIWSFGLCTIQLSLSQQKYLLLIIKKNMRYIWNLIACSIKTFFLCAWPPTH